MEIRAEQDTSRRKYSVVLHAPLLHVSLVQAFRLRRKYTHAFFFYKLKPSRIYDVNKNYWPVSAVTPKIQKICQYTVHVLYIRKGIIT
jgi:hypothetical protein